VDGPRGTNYSAVDSPGGPLLGGTTYSMTELLIFSTLLLLQGTQILYTGIYNTVTVNYDSTGYSAGLFSVCNPATNARTYILATCIPAMMHQVQAVVRKGEGR